ncbi:hypothetical protein [Rhizobium mongolense]
MDNDVELLNARSAPPDDVAKLNAKIADLKANLAEAKDEIASLEIDLVIAAEDAGKGEEGHYKLLRQIGGFEPHRSHQNFTSEIRYLPPSLDGFAGGIMSRNCLFFGVYGTRARYQHMIWHTAHVYASSSEILSNASL